MPSIDDCGQDHYEISDYGGSEKDRNTDDAAESSSDTSGASSVPSTEAAPLQNGDVGDPDVETPETAARRDRAQFAKLVARHPCPCEEAIVQWLSRATRRAEGSDTEHSLGTLPELLQWMAWSSKNVLAWFHYPSLSSLWQAPRQGREEARRRQREVGEELYRQGGVPCLQLHYYMLNYIMRREEECAAC